ncbi:NUDIX hydrolase [Silanimonas sp.]|jgi:8-oxo-dGTP pyrophosphatase MutT (NUDIX family)|uniref:NUDIX hydrolase n=1 Tax=Silanimonas sp. TaxID=1929290 RepID=UPI0037C786FC
MDPKIAEFIDSLRRYAQTCPEHRSLMDDFAGFAAVAPDVFTRAHLAGHFTGSAFVVSADGARALLLHHAKLDRWLQPGGHADGEIDLAAVALREAEEETGLPGLVVESGIFDLDRHGIPARGAEPEHSHWDVRFVVRCTSDETPQINRESRAAAWRRIDELAVDGTLEPSIRRMAARWLARSGSGAA